MLQHLAVFAAGFGSGFLNVLAGGGSLLTLPLLIFLGLPVAVANGTNRVAILVQNVAAVAAFRRQGEGLGRAREGVAWGLATIPGAVAGAWLAVRVAEPVFRALLAGVLVLGVVGLLVPARPGRPGKVTRGRWVGALCAFVGIGFYGGFVQAGVGFLLMLVLHQVLGFDLVRTNVHKVLIVLVFSVPALAVFVASGNIAWPAAVVLSLGNAVGAVIATRVAIRGGDRPVRIAVGVALLIMAVRLVQGS